MANHGRRRQIWPPSAPHEAFRSARTRRMDGPQPPKHGDIIFEAVEGVHGPQTTPMLWRCIIAGTKECFEGRTHPQPPKKLHPLSRGVIAHPLEALARSPRPHVGC
jgi:hypothetical protein